MNNFGAHTIERQDEDIIIKLSIDQLISSVENCPEFPCKIVDKNKFVEYIIDNYFDFTISYEDDPIFLKHFDDLVDNACENGEEFVQFIDEEEDE